MSEQTTLGYLPFCSALDAGFWHVLSKNKLEVYGLDESAKPIHGFYVNGDAANVPCRLNVDYTAFDLECKIPPRSHLARGLLINKNTLENFKSCDKQVIIDSQALKIWEAITSGEAITDHSLLTPFVLLTFADLKKYVYYYWFVFPCICTEEGFTSQVTPVTHRFTSQQSEKLMEGYDSLNTPAYFIIVEREDGDVTVDSLSNATLYTNQHKVIFSFSDPCTLDSHPGWPLRNYLALISYHFIGGDDERVEVLCYRDRTKYGQRSIDHSIVLSLHLSPLKQFSDYPKSLGWERNEKHKLHPRKVDLSTSMDPVKLSESSVDLNLKLMKWRLLPELDLDLISSRKCLLLGSGTLGCNVARCLMGWGVRTITFVDNSRISYSNPVRQSLYNFDDCLHGGRQKAEAAADSLARIFPGIISRGVNLSIPMPGHSIPEHLVEQIKKDVQQLECLIEEHDVVFLLLDTRESRWLPSLIGAASHKIVMNAALGFDSYLVLRHGFKTETPLPNPTHDNLMSVVHGSHLGCYFCNDVVAPGDSTRDRTLDQQCTVSRPGMSMMVAALVVEMYMSVLQHPLQGGAPADTSSRDEHMTNEFSCCLGLIPHQIRGFLSRFYNILAATRAFQHCTACSTTVLNEYKTQGFDFLLKAFNQPTYLEDLTGLTALHAMTFSDQVWCLSDDESVEDMDA